MDCPDDGLCVTTTGKAGFRLNATFSPVTLCKRNADCVSGDLSVACVRCGTGAICGVSF